MSIKKYTPVQDLITKFIDEKGLKNKNYKSSENVWLEIVGEKLFQACRLIDIKNETIIIEVDHPGVAQSLKASSKSTLEKVRKAFPELPVKNIRTVMKKNYINAPQYQSENFSPELKKNSSTVQGATKTTGKVKSPLSTKKQIPQELKDILERMANSTCED